MTISRFTARDMTAAVRIIGDGRENLLTSTVFKRGGLHPTDTIDFGKMQIKARVAVYQRPGGPAVPVNKSTADAKTVKAPKIREKIVLDENFATVLNAALPNYQGPFGTNPNDQLPEKVAMEQRKLRDRIEKAIELQAAQGLTTGQVTITFEDGTTATITFEFTTAAVETDYDKTIMLARTGTNLWSAANSKPWHLLEYMGKSIRDNSDYSGQLKVLMGLDAYLAFEDNEKVLKHLDNRNLAAGTLAPVEGAYYRGTYRGMRIFQYSNGYVNTSDARIEAFDSKKIVVLPDQQTDALTIEYGAVFDRPAPDQQAQFIQTDYFSKMVSDSEDPPVDEIIVESRPLALIKNPAVLRVCQVV